MTRSTNMEHVEVLRDVLRKAFRYGETHWQQADSEYASDHRKAGETMDKFRAWADETAAAIASLSAPKHKAGDNMEAGAGHVQGSEWVLVPREPSAGMWDSAENAMIEAECAYNEGNQDTRSDAHSFPTMRIWQAVVGYRAMLAAAPQPPAEAQPVAWQYQDRDGKWHGFTDESHRLNTIEDGSWPVRALYAHPPPSAPVGVEAVRYDAGLLSDYGGGNVEWWQDYIRAELERAHDFYTEALAQQPAAVEDWLIGDLMEAEEGGHTAHTPAELCGLAAKALKSLTAQQPAAVDGAWQNKVADALDSFWNPACGAIQEASYHGPASGSDVVGAIAQGLAAVAASLRESALAQQPAAVDGLVGLDNIAGYFQDGSEETLRVTPDDATRTWHVYVGKRHLGHGKSIRAALTAALAAQHQEPTT